MSELKTVKEVCELTGLTKKLLYDYKELGIVKPTGYRSRGYVDSKGREYEAYKMYDEDAIIKLHQIAIFRKLGVKRAEIKKRMTASNYDSNQLLEEQIQMLKAQKQKIEELIIVAEQLKVLGMKNPFVKHYSTMNFNDLVKNAELWQSSAYFENTLNQSFEEYDRESEGILEELFSLNEEMVDSQKAMEIVQHLLETVTKYYGFVGWLTVFVCALSGQGGGKLSAEISVDIEESTVKVSSKAVMNYIVKSISDLQEEFLSIIINHYSVIGIDFTCEKVLGLVEDLKELLEKQFHITKKQEYELLFDFIQVPPYQKGDGYISYVFSLVKHYCLP